MASHHLSCQPIVVGVNYAICSLTNHILSITAMEEDDPGADLADVHKSKTLHQAIVHHNFLSAEQMVAALQWQLLAMVVMYYSMSLCFIQFST